MSKRREYKNYPPTDAPQQKPGTLKQAQAENTHIQTELLTHQPGKVDSVKRHDPPDTGSPVLIGDEEIP